MSAILKSTVALRSTVASTAAFLKWMRDSTYGDITIYHVGHLSQARAESKKLDDLAGLVSLASDFNVVMSSQFRMPLIYQTMNAYVATRNSGNAMPRSIMTGQLTGEEYRALSAINCKDATASIPRAVRYEMGITDAQALRLVEQLAQGGHLEKHGARWAASPSVHSTLHALQPV